MPWSGDLNDAHGSRSAEEEINVLLRQYEHQNPLTATPLGVTQLYGPPMSHGSIDIPLAINLWPITEPPRCRSFPQSHGCPNTQATNGQEVFVVKYPKDQNGNTIPQAMAAVHRAITHGSNPSENDLVQFLQYETGSYMCLCLDGGPCGKRFERRHRAVDHVRGHFGLRAYPCRGGCGKPKW